MLKSDEDLTNVEAPCSSTPGTYILNDTSNLEIQSSLTSNLVNISINPAILGTSNMKTINFEVILDTTNYKRVFTLTIYKCPNITCTSCEGLNITEERGICLSCEAGFDIKD